ncbi:MAG: hypothetical protein IPH35_04820 [Rhodoferax sp.]|nr:hypothetical protein [Rhodoferax sp.]
MRLLSKFSDGYRYLVNAPTLIEIAQHMHLEAYFSRVNWKAHLLPIIEAEVQSFSSQQRTQHLKEPHMSVLSQDVARGYFDNQKSEIWGDSITISLGRRPIPAIAVAPVKGSIKILSEEQPSLVFSQFVSGSVIALLYPPSSEVAKPLKPYYVVDSWANPASVRPKRIKQLLALMNEADLFCGAATYPNSRGQRLLAMLEARDAVLAKGGSRIWVWLCYTFKATTGVLRLYGIGKPIVP